MLKPGHLPTPALTKRISLIFLWVELYRMDPTPIVNPLQYTVCIFWKEMGCTLLFGFAVILHSWFQNRPPLLVLTCWQCDDKLNVFGRIINECSLTLIVYRYWHVFFITWWPTNRKWGVILLTEIENRSLCKSLTASKVVIKNTNKYWFEICEKNNDTWHFNIKHNKCKNTIVVQYKIAHNVHFFVHYHENHNKTNINHLPSRFWL